MDITTTQRGQLRALGERLLAREDLQPGSFDHLLAAGVLVDQRPPGAADRTRMTDVARDRAAGGASLDAVLDAIGLAQRRVWEQCGAEIARARDGAGTLSVAGSLLLAWHGALTAAAVETFRRLEQTGRMGDRDRRAALLSGVLQGTIDASAVPELAEADADAATWRALRARPIPPTTTTLLERALESALERSSGLVATIAGDVHGFVAARPRIRREMAYVALGPAGDARALPSSFVTATRVLEAAQSLDVRGVTAMEDLRLRLAVVESKGVGAEVVRRCLDPLAGKGSFGRVVRATLEAYVEAGARIDPAAASLGVHPNTVRHRLRRYEEITGLDLARVDDVVELWWALERDGLA